MKLSFKQSSSSKSSTTSKSKPALQDSSEKPEFLTEFDPSKTLISNKSTSKTLIIPPKQNEWKPSKKMKNLDLPPLHSGGKPLEFEVESDDLARPEPGPDISYGLNVRQQQQGSGGGENGNGIGNPKSIDAIMIKKLRSDLDRLGDGEEEGFDGYNDVPVESFAEALMAGYGWKKGMGIGRNAKVDTKVVEYKRWSAKEGIGFTLDSGGGGDDGSKKSKAKVKEKEENGNGGGGGGVRFGVGKEVRVVDGKDVGMKGRVVEVLPGGESIVLKLLRSGDEVKVGVNEVADLGSLEEEKCLKRLKELRIRGSKDDIRSGNDNGSDKRGNDSYGRRKESKRSREEGGSSGSRSGSGGVSWLRSHIRVRVISKSFKGGRFYLKKGVVVDVVGPTTCDITMDDGGEFVQGVEQDKLETALPRRGGPVVVLFGKHKGVYGSLIEKDSEREAGVVQDADSCERFKVRLEQIAEYVGDPSDIGY